jgi:hypothetical protein
MTSRRRTLFTAAGVAASVLLLLVALPYLFRDRIAARVQAAIGSAVDADVHWSAVGLSLLRSFPNASLRLNDVSVVGRAPFAGDTLAQVARFRLVVALPSVLRGVRGTGPLKIRSIEVDRPVVRLRVLADGAANWDIVAARETVEPVARERAPMALDLRRLAVRDGALYLDDAQSGLVASLTGLQHTLAGDFGASRFRIETRTDAASADVRFAGVPYLSRVRLAVEATLDVDGEAGRIAVDRGELRLNALVLALNGAVTTSGEVLGLDVTFDAPGVAFAEILSLVPALRTQPGFADVRTDGTVAVRGFVRGDYGENAFPAFDVTATVRDGRFQFPDLPLPARDVFLDLAVTNPGGDADSTVVRVDRFHIIIGSNPIDGAFTMRTPISDPAVDARVTGRLDLAELNRTVVIDGAEELSGVVAADVTVRTRRSDLDACRYDQVAAAGTVRASQVALRMEDLPHAFEVEELLLRLAPAAAELETFQGMIGSSDVAMTGRVENLLGFAFRDEELRGSARVSSVRFDLDEWRSDDELEAVLVPRNIDFTLEADVQRLVFGDLDLRNARGALRIHEERATLNDFRLDLFGGAMAVHGFYDTSVPTRPLFDMELAITSIDVAQAAAGMPTFRALAPAARYAQGRVSTELRLSGAVGEDMTPVYEVLSGRGSLETAGLSLQGFPAFDRLADLLRVEQLRNPGLVDLRSSFQIRDGRVVVSPFDVRIGPFSATVSGSHGLDETLDYTLALQLPRALLGAEANRAVAQLAAQAGRAGFDWSATEEVTLGVRLGGTVAVPSVATDFREVRASALAGAGAALREEVDRRVGAVEQRVDSAADAARRRAEEEAVRILEEAERQAARIRAEALPVAEAVRREGYDRADALLAQAANPAARVAARAGADRLRREADAGADRIIREADERADAVLEEARRRAGVTGSPSQR